MVDPPIGRNLTWKWIGADSTLFSSAIVIFAPRVIPRFQFGTAPFIGGSAASSGVISVTANTGTGAATRVARTAMRKIVVDLPNIDAHPTIRRLCTRVH